MNGVLKNKKVMIVIGILILLISVGFIVFTIVDSKDNDSIDNNKQDVSENVNEEVNNNEEVVEEKKLNIIDVNSNSRPVAVMINNLNAARNYHSGLEDAYIVYEFPIEGGITRMMALFKDKNNHSNFA